MFRCPSCAKVGKLPLTSDYALLAHPDMNKWYIVKEPITLTSTFIPVLNLEETADKMAEMDLEFDGHYPDPEEGRTDYSPDMQCAVCGEFHPFTEWHKAWEFPGDFFDGDQLCSCGGELWWDKIPGSSRYALVCEKCEWVKPQAIISGHEG